MRVALLSVLFASVCLAAEADGAPGEHPSLVQGRDAFNALEHDRCLEHLGEARRAKLTPGEHVTLELYSGLCHAYAGRVEAASSHFRAALALDRSAALPVFISPKVQSLFGELAEEMRALPIAASPPAVSAPASPALTPQAEQQRDGWRAPSPTSWVLAGAGASSAAAGVAFGIGARAAELRAREAAFESDWVRESQSAVSGARVANVAFGVAASFAVAAVVSYLLTPDEAK